MESIKQEPDVVNNAKNKVLAGHLERQPVYAINEAGVALVNGAGATQQNPSSSPISVPPSFSALASPKQIQNEENHQKVGFVNNWNALVSFLNPSHAFFSGRQGTLDGFYEYVHKDKKDNQSFFYAKIAPHNRQNPYRLYQNARSHTGRTIGQLRAVIEANGLEDFRQVNLVMTLPSEVSEELARRGKRGISNAWSMFHRIWSQLPTILGINGDLAGMVNLHIWKSENPLKPHYHFHIIIINYCRQNEAGEEKLIKFFGEGIRKKYINHDRKVRTGAVAFSVDELKVIKNEWTKIVRDSCRRNKLECRYLNSGEIDKALNVFIDFVKWDQAPKFIHKINYQKRHWVEDYVKFTEQNPNCPNPPEWLQHYSNTSRAFGWWKQLKAFGGGNDLKPEPKIDCNTGEELVYVRHVNSFLDLQDLPLYCYDNCKGKPIIAPLNSNDVAWLKSCFAANLYDKYYDPGGE